MTDAAGGTLSYSATGLPAGLSISTTTGKISGTTGSEDFEKQTSFVIDDTAINVS